MKRRAFTGTEIMLICALLAVWAVYAYYFILIPQYWTLRDDYAFARSWGAPGADQWLMGESYLKGIMKSGRFQPVDALWRVLHYKYLPVTPRVFRITYFITALSAIGFFAWFLTRYKLALSQILLAVLLVSSNLALKEWLVTLTVSEGLATMFLFASLVLFTASRTWVRWTAVLVFPLSFMSKESFFIFAGVFVIVDAATAYDKRKPLMRVLRSPALGIVAVTLAFVLFVVSLPRVYTTNLSPTKIGLLPLLKSFVLPPLKSFAPAFLLVGFSLVTQRRFPRDWVTRSLLLAGAYIVVAFTLFINAWGPFDSWFYLHTAIPFGWAIVMGVLWKESSITSKREQALLAAVFVYALLATVNGARNYSTYFETSTTVAEVACDDHERVPGLQIFSNCIEGAAQLTHYLKLEKKCSNPPKIEFVGAATDKLKNLAPPYEFLISKYCEPFSPAEYATKHKLSIGPWTVHKKLE